MVSLKEAGLVCALRSAVTSAAGAKSDYFGGRLVPVDPVGRPA
jgi:hypothetical protein